MEPAYVIVACLAVLSALAVTLRPFWGLLAVTALNQVDSVLPLPGGLSIGRALGVFVALGWLLLLLTRGRTTFWHHRDINLPLLVLVVVFLAATLMGATLERGLPEVLRLGLLATMTMFIQDFVRNRRQLEILLLVFALSIGLSSFVGLVQYRDLQQGLETFGTVHSYSEGFRIAGIRTNPNEYAFILASGLPFLVFSAWTSRSPWARVFFLGMLAACLFVLALTLSRTHVFAAAVFFVLLMFMHAQAFLRNPRALLLLAGAAAGAAVLIAALPMAFFRRMAALGDDSSSDVRRLVFEKSLALLQTHPLLGAGAHGLGRTHISGFERIYRMGPHDMFSYLASSSGLMGLAAFAVLVLIALSKLYHIRTQPLLKEDPYLRLLHRVCAAGFLAMLLSSGGNIILHQRVFWVHLALIGILSRPTLYDLRPTTVPGSRPHRSGAARAAPLPGSVTSPGASPTR